MEQCAYCQTVYGLGESNSSIPDALCSEECEKNYKEAFKNLKIEEENKSV